MPLHLSPLTLDMFTLSTLIFLRFLLYVLLPCVHITHTETKLLQPEFVAKTEELEKNI